MKANIVKLSNQPLKRKPMGTVLKAVHISLVKTYWQPFFFVRFSPCYQQSTRSLSMHSTGCLSLFLSIWLRFCSSLMRALQEVFPKRFHDYDGAQPTSAAIICCEKRLFYKFPGRQRSSRVHWSSNTLFSMEIIFRWKLFFDTLFSMEASATCWSGHLLYGGCVLCSRQMLPPGIGTAEWRQQATWECLCDCLCLGKPSDKVLSQKAAKLTFA